jgi:hypothetical protein
MGASFRLKMIKNPYHDHKARAFENTTLSLASVYTYVKCDMINQSFGKYSMHFFLQDSISWTALITGYFQELAF